MSISWKFDLYINQNTSLHKYETKMNQHKLCTDVTRSITWSLLGCNCIMLHGILSTHCNLFYFQSLQLKAVFLTRSNINNSKCWQEFNKLYMLVTVPLIVPAPWCNNDAADLGSRVESVASTPVESVVRGSEAKRKNSLNYFNLNKVFWSTSSYLKERKCYVSFFVGSIY